MLFKEFINHIAISLPSNIITGKITDIKYRTNPIKIAVNNKSKNFVASFHDRYIYDKIVGKQEPKIGDNILIYLDHNNNIKHIKIS